VFTETTEGDLLWVQVDASATIESWTEITHTGDSWTEITHAGDTWAEITHTGDSWSEVAPSSNETWTEYEYKRI